MLKNGLNVEKNAKKTGFLFFQKFFFPEKDSTLVI